MQNSAKLYHDIKPDINNHDCRLATTSTATRWGVPTLWESGSNATFVLETPAQSCDDREDDDDKMT